MRKNVGRILSTGSRLSRLVMRVLLLHCPTYVYGLFFLRFMNRGQTSVVCFGQNRGHACILLVAQLSLMLRSSLLLSCLHVLAISHLLPSQTSWRYLQWAEKP